MKKHYDTLGVDEQADETALKRAFRDRSKTAHPDTGGATDEFVELKHAFDVLSDPVRRLKYDRTGDDKQEKPLSVRAAEKLSELFVQWASRQDPGQYDLAEAVKSEIAAMLLGAKEKAKHCRLMVARFDDAAARVTGSEPVIASLKAQAMEARRKEQIVLDGIELGKAMMDLCNTITYRVDPVDPIKWNTTVITRFG